MSELQVALRDERTGMLAWSLAMLGFMLLIGVSYTAVKDSTELDELWNEYPEGLREAFGGTQSLTSVDGYLESQATSLMPILIGVYAVTAGTKRLAGYEEQGRLDHLLSRPTTRGRHFWMVSAAVGVGCAAFLGALALGAVLGFAAAGVGAADLGRTALAVLDLVPVAIFMCGLGVMLGAMGHRRGPVLGVGMGVVFGGFVLQIISGVVDDLSWLEFFSPHGLYLRSDLFHGEPDAAYYAILPVLGALLAVIGWFVFDRKDVYA